jgi:lysophospholipase
MCPARAQFMQMDRDQLPEPVQEKGKAEAGVTPIMAWIDPGVEAKGYLLCVHGLGLHKGTYKNFGERMSKLGWGVYACDIRGFGTFMSMPGERRVDFPGCLEDVRSALEMIHKSHPGKGVFLVGESMGGGITLHMTSLHPELIDGLVCSVPGAKRETAGTEAMHVGPHLLMPHKEMKVDFVVKAATKDEALQAAWLADPLGRCKLTPAELLQFQHFMNQNDQAAKNVTATPVLMIQGVVDKLVDPKANQVLFDDIPSPNKMRVCVDQGEHLLLEQVADNEQFSAGLIEMISDWLDHHDPKVSAK